MLRCKKIVILGAGLVGLELIRQIIGKQGKRIKERFSLDLRIVAIADSSGFVEIQQDSSIDVLEEYIAFKNAKKSFKDHHNFSGEIGSINGCKLFDILIC
jgi:homoserine dehydrogenase